MAERGTSLDEAIEWLEMPIDGLGGKTLGRIAGIHLDVEDGEPRWVLIRLGPLAGCTAIPVEHVAEAAERLWTGYERDLVNKAPRFKPDDSLSAAQELELAAHWGMDAGWGRAAEVADRDVDEITAVPAPDPER
jgi:hypothetical protein